MKIKKICKYCNSELIIDEKEIKDITKKERNKIDKEIEITMNLNKIFSKQINENEYDSSAVLGASLLNFKNYQSLINLNKKYFICPICKKENWL